MFIRPKQVVRISFTEFVNQYDQFIDELSKGKAFTVFTTEHEITIHKHTLLNGAYFISDDNDVRGYNETHDVYGLLKKVKRALNVTSEVEKKQQVLSDELNLAVLQQACLEKLGVTQETDVYSSTLRTIFIGGDHFYEEDKTETARPDALNADVKKQHRSEDNQIYQIAHTYMIPTKQHLAKTSLFPVFVPNAAMINALNSLKGELTVDDLTGWRDVHKMQISDFTENHGYALIQLVLEEKISPDDAIAKISEFDQEQLTKLISLQRGCVAQTI